MIEQDPAVFAALGLVGLTLVVVIRIAAVLP